MVNVVGPVPTDPEQFAVRSAGFASCLQEQVLAARGALTEAVSMDDELASAAASSRLEYLLGLAAEHGVGVARPEQAADPAGGPGDGPAGSGHRSGQGG